MYTRLGEIIGLDASIAVTLAAHQAIGLKVKCLGFLMLCEGLKSCGGVEAGGLLSFTRK